MTLAVEVKTTGQNATDTNSYATASVSFTANALALIAIVYTDFGRDPSIPDSVTGGGMTTWARYTGAGGAFDSTSAHHGAMWLYHAQQASPGAGAAITIALDQTHTMMQWFVLEVTDVTVGNNGLDAFVQDDFGAGNGTTSTVTFDNAFGSSNNLALAIHGLSQGVSPNFTGTTDWTAIVAGGIAGSEILSSYGEYRVGDFDSAPTWDTDDWGSMIFEIEEAVSAAVGPPVRHHHRMFTSRFTHR